MNRILADVVGILYLRERAPVVMRVGAAACSALFALVWVPDAQAQEGPGQTTESQDLAQPFSRQEPGWLKPAPKTGTPVRVTERSGKSTTGRLAGVLPSAIRLVSDGVMYEAPLADI